MRVFVTGATGFIGSAVVQNLLLAGHQVLGLARSEAAAAMLLEAGAQVHRGNLEHLASLKNGADSADSVIHTAFIHDFSTFQNVCEIDRQAIEALGSALAGSDRPLLVTSGTALVKPGRLATEDDACVWTSADFPRVATEEAAHAVAQLRVNISVIRLSPSVHGDGDDGFIPSLIRTARDKGISAYTGEGANRWTAVHRLDAADLYRLALEKGSPGARYHGVDEEQIAFRDIAEVIGKRLNVPVVAMSTAEAAEHFGRFARFAQLDGPASSKLTRERLGWQPKQPGLLAELEQSTDYFQA